MADSIWSRIFAKTATQSPPVSQDQEKLRAILSAMEEGVLAMDWDDRLVLCNEAAQRLLGFLNKPRPSMRIWDLPLPASVHDILLASRLKKEDYRGELELSVEGRKIILDTHSRRFPDGSGEGIIIVFHDVTRLRRLDEIRRDFVANVSHEIKTPLTSIRGYVETLADSPLEENPGNRRFLGKIQDSVARLSTLAGDLLALARAESPEVPPHLSPMNLSAFVEKAAARRESDLQKRKLVLSLDPWVPDGLVMGDAEGLTQIFDNLLDNALRYSPDGGQIRMGLSKDADRILLEVEDSGVGIPAKDLDRIFERFYRVDKARSRDSGGTGLGLAIVKHRVLALGGEIRASSEEGRGSCFRLWFPEAKI